jgi:hypothetical protein
VNTTIHKCSKAAKATTKKQKKAATPETTIAPTAPETPAPEVPQISPAQRLSALLNAIHSMRKAASLRLANAYIGIFEHRDNERQQIVRRQITVKASTMSEAAAALEEGLAKLPELQGMELVNIELDGAAL